MSIAKLFINMQSYLIIGGSVEERKKQALKISREHQISGFDFINLKKEGIKSIGIEQIRGLQHQLNLKPYSSKGKLAFLSEAEKLTQQAQNAMLKLLEEPPVNTFIVLSAPNPDLLLPTIISRCQIISLNNKPLKINQSIINDQLSIINSILKSGVGERIKTAGEIVKSKDQARDQAIEFCQNQLILWREKALKSLTDTNSQHRAKIIRQIQKTIIMLNANTNPKLCLESLLFQYPNLRSRNGTNLRSGKT